MVIIKGNVRKVLIIARGLITKIGDEHKLFDYGGCIYPEGLIGDKILYFNHKDIANVIFEGYTDEDNERMIENINDWVERSSITKGNPYELNQQNLKLSIK